MLGRPCQALVCQSMDVFPGIQEPVLGWGLDELSLDVLHNCGDGEWETRIIQSLHNYRLGKFVCYVFINLIKIIIHLIYWQVGVYLFYYHLYTRDTRLPRPLRVTTSSAMWLNLGVFGFLQNTHEKANAKQMRSRSTRTIMLRPQYMQVTYACDEPQLFWLREKPERPPNWAPCQDQDGTGSGISGVYLWENYIQFITYIKPACIIVC